MRDEFYFPSKDGNTEIHTIEWKPEGEVKAVLQLCHGMVSISGDMMSLQNLCAAGATMWWEMTILDMENPCRASRSMVFNEKYGNACVIGDMHTLRQRTMKKYPDVPYFILGHSMGSLLVRQYIQLYGNGLSGAVLLGVVSDQKKAVLLCGKRLCRLMAAFRGWHFRSRFIDGMVLGSYNKKFKPARTRVDWMTSDREHLDAYVADPLCSFVFTVNAYYSMFTGMLNMEKKESIYMIPKTLPILFASGTDDPVGNFGKGVRKIYEQYKAAGLQDVTLRLYAGDRHELLNETDRQQVYQDLFDWLEEKRTAAK